MGRLTDIRQSENIMPRTAYCRCTTTHLFLMAPIKLSWTLSVYVYFCCLARKLHGCSRAKIMRIYTAVTIFNVEACCSSYCPFTNWLNRQFSQNYFQWLHLLLQLTAGCLPITTLQKVSDVINFKVTIKWQCKLTKRWYARWYRFVRLTRIIHKHVKMMIINASVNYICQKKTHVQCISDDAHKTTISPAFYRATCLNQWDYSEECAEPIHLWVVYFGFFVYAFTNKSITNKHTK